MSQARDAVALGCIIRSRLGATAYRQYSTFRRSDKSDLPPILANFARAPAPGVVV